MSSRMTPKTNMKLKIALLAVAMLSAGLLFAQKADGSINLLNPNFTSGDWNSWVTVEEGVAAPDGSGNSYKISRKETSGNESLLRAGHFQIAPRMKLSVFAKAGSPGAKLYLRLLFAEKPDSKLDESVVAFDLEDGTISQKGDLFEAKMEPGDNGWYQCSITGQSIDEPPYKFLDIGVTSNGVVGGVEGDFIYIWNPILEEQAAATQLSPGPEKKKTPSVLFIVGHSGCGFEIASKLQKAGFNVNSLAYPTEGFDGPPLKWDDISKYNVLVVVGLGQSNADFSLSDTNKSNIEVLNRFLKEGGGIFYIPVWGQVNTPNPPQKAFLEPLGVNPLFDSMPIDPENSQNATTWKIDFAKTANIAASPLTEGVKNLWFPVNTRAGAQNHTTPFLADKNWTLGIRGEKSCSTQTIANTGHDAAKVADPVIKSEVPILAFRQVGKGRIVCFGITPEYLFSNVGSTTLEGIVMEKGLKKVPSDGYRLIENSLKWLAGPSLSETALGGAPMNKALPENAFMTKFGDPFVWDEKVRRPEAPAASPGLIGARTNYSSGKGSVAEWVAEAKKNGLSFIVFLEEFSSLSRENFEKLKKDCEKLTDAKFAAIPGFTIDDEIGNHYFYYGTKFAYPPKDFLSKDGKVFISRDPSYSPDQPFIKGQLAMTTIDYTYVLNGFNLTAGNYLFSKDAAPFANFFSDWDATGVVTSQQGKVTENALTDYLSLVDCGQGPVPIAIDFMTEPSQISKSPWKTIVRMGDDGAVVGRKLEGANKIAAYWNSWNFYPDNPAKIYITEGPSIDNWSFVGFPDYGSENKGDFVWQNLRWRVYGKASSEAGLKKIEIFDGTELFRNFLLAGEKEYEFSLELNHDKQHNLVMVVEDVNGKKAISGEQWDRNHRLEEFQCADRNNQLSYGYSTNAGGYGIKLGGNQCLATPNKRVGSSEVSPSGTFKNDPLLGNPAFDGVAGNEPVFFNMMNLLGSNGETACPAVVESFRKLHTCDVNIGEGKCENNFTDNIMVGNVWRTLWKTEPGRDFTVVKRLHFFNIDPDSPLAVFIYKMKLTLKRDLPNTGILAGFFRTGDTNLWVLKGSDGSFSAGNWETNAISPNRELSVPFGAGAYAGLLDTPLGGAAIFPLSSNLQANISLPEKVHSNLRITVPADQSPQKAGESAEVSFILLGIPRPTELTRNLPGKSNEILERFNRDFGLDGGKTGYTLNLKAGKLVSQRYILDIDGKQAACMLGTIDGKLVSTLPVTVSGLNDRWSAFLYDANLKESRPVGVFEGKAWAVVPVKGKTELFIGHPVTADNPDILIQVSQTGSDSWSIELHNPTDKALNVNTSLNPGFAPFTGKKLAADKVEVPAGKSTFLSL